MNFIEYVKQLWKNGPGGGTPWSAARLNHMEDGIKNNNSMISELNNNKGINVMSETNTADIEDIFPKYLGRVVYHTLSNTDSNPFRYGFLTTYIWKDKSSGSYSAFQSALDNTSINSLAIKIRKYDSNKWSDWKAISSNNNINKIITTKYYRCNGSNPVLKIPMEANHCCIAVFGYTYSGEGTADTAFLGLLSISWGGKLKYNSLFGQNFENITYNSSDKIIEITFSGHYVTACAINFWG